MGKSALTLKLYHPASPKLGEQFTLGPTEHGVTGGLQLAPRRVPQPKRLAGSWPLPLAWALVIREGRLRGRP